MASDAGWRADLEEWLRPLLAALGHPARRAMCPLYLAGLIGPGERKSIQPMAERLGLPSHDALHHFIAAGIWDAAPLEAVLAREADRLVGGRDAFLIVDDTALPKKGTRSVGVAPQYASALGKNANCQVLVSLTLARREVPAPFALRLFLPEEWTAVAARLESAGVPETWRTPRTKPEIALAEIDRAIAAGGRFGCTLADAGYGISASFRVGLSARGLRWAVGIPHILKVYPADVVLQPPPARSRRKLSEPDRRSRSAETVLAEAAWRRVVWRMRVATLQDALSANDAPDALEAASALIDHVIVHPPGAPGDPAGIELVGQLMAMLRAGGAQLAEGSDARAEAVLGLFASSVKAGWGGRSPPQQTAPQPPIAAPMP